MIPRNDPSMPLSPTNSLSNYLIPLSVDIYCIWDSSCDKGMSYKVKNEGRGVDVGQRDCESDMTTRDDERPVVDSGGDENVEEKKGGSEKKKLREVLIR